MIRLRRQGLQRLGPSDRRRVMAVLDREPEHNVYLAAQVERGALARDEVAGPMMGYFRDGEIEAVACCGSNLVVSVPASDAALEAVAFLVRRRRYNVRVVVGDDATVDRFMAAYGRATRPILLERSGQVLYRLERGGLDPTAREPQLRQAAVEELDHVVETDRAMVYEELGFDPFSADLASYRLGWLRRIREGRAWVIGGPGGPPAFKIDQSATSERVIQLSGVYTQPQSRRLGIARRGVGEMAHRLLQTADCVTLYVHRENTPALRLYEGLGFEPAGAVRSVWFEPQS